MFGLPEGKIHMAAKWFDKNGATTKFTMNDSLPHLSNVIFQLSGNPLMWHSRMNVKSFKLPREAVAYCNGTHVQYFSLSNNSA